MGVYIIDLGRLDPRALQRALHRLARAAPGRIGLGEMMIVGRNAITNYLGQDFGAASPRSIEIFQEKNRCAFAQDQPGAIAVEGPAAFGGRGLERIEANKYQF